jgi:ubiquinone/menaquinone biosynthesis C-methylase UbiE
MTSSAWQNEEVARRFIEETRAAIPYHGDQLGILLDLVARFRPEPHRIVDLGCGDGVLTRLLLSRYPEARCVLLDHSEPMLARAREALTDRAAQCEIRLADLSQPLCAAPEASVDLVVSSYAIHHLPHARKRSLYEEVFALLAPGSLFVNVEHVASATPELESLWEALIARHLAAHQGRPVDEVAAELRQRPDKDDNILERVETQMEWLRAIGFTHVDCYFRWLELAVFGGVRPVSSSR